MRSDGRLRYSVGGVITIGDPKDFNGGGSGVALVEESGDLTAGIRREELPDEGGGLHLNLKSDQVLNRRNLGDCRADSAL